MNVEIKNRNYEPGAIKPLLDYIVSADSAQKWEYFGLLVEIDPTFDFKGNDALIRWTDVQEGFQDKLIVQSLDEFQSIFLEVNA